MAVAIRFGSDKPPGTPGGIGAEAAVSAILTGVADVAESLYKNRDRIGQSLGEWLSAPLLPRNIASATAAPMTWKERERQRQLKRSLETVQKASIRTEDLQKAATAAIGRRIVRKHMVIAETPQKRVGTGAVSRIAEVLRALLLDPIHLTIMASAAGGGGLSLHPFGLGRCRQFAIRSFSPAELSMIQYMAISAETWVDLEACEQNAGGETLVAGAEVNDAFEVALDRLSLVSIVCEHISRQAGLCHKVRQTLECAVMTAASMPDIIASGYYEGLVGLAMAIRCDQPRNDRYDKERAAKDAAYVAMYGIEFTDGDAFVSRIQKHHV